jgi:hypothetical protein
MSAIAAAATKVMIDEEEIEVNLSEYFNGDWGINNTPTTQGSSSITEGKIECNLSDFIDRLTNASQDTQQEDECTKNAHNTVHNNNVNNDANNKSHASRTDDEELQRLLAAKSFHLPGNNCCSDWIQW